jgi:hypothetical protein
MGMIAVFRIYAMPEGTIPPTPQAENPWASVLLTKTFLSVNTIPL